MMVACAWFQYIDQKVERDGTETEIGKKYSDLAHALQRGRNVIVFSCGEWAEVAFHTLSCILDTYELPRTLPYFLPYFG
jgi:hypothetical protein